jgi:quercetin dioxygenase-like cupin family protein
MGGAAMGVFDGMRVIGPTDGIFVEGRGSRSRELVSQEQTDGRWRLGEVVAIPDDEVTTHVHPGEPEAILILAGDIELHGATGITRVGSGDVVFIPPDTEHGLRTPEGGRWLAIWPIGDRLPGGRYAG